MRYRLLDGYISQVRYRWNTPSPLISPAVVPWCSLKPTSSPCPAARFIYTLSQRDKTKDSQQDPITAIPTQQYPSDEKRPAPEANYHVPHEFPYDTVFSQLSRSWKAEDPESMLSTYERLDPSELRYLRVRSLAARLSFYQRQFYSKKNPTKLEKRENLMVQKVVRMMISDLQAGKLEPDPMANVHLLGYFRDANAYESGKRFWAWLREQDIHCTDARTYGAAIELLTWAGAPLSELEALFKEALIIDPGQFSEYHLSPNAIVTIKTQYAPLSGLRMLLLQGILTARVMRGDWRNAYLALDTGIRLGVDLVPPRFFEALIYPRPLSEAWKIFMLACQTGIHLARRTLSVLLARLRRSQSYQNHPSKNIAIARAGLTAVHAYVGTGDKLSYHHLLSMTDLLLGSLYILPPRPAPDSKSARKETLEDHIQRCMDMFQSHGVQPSSSFYNMIIIRACRLKRPTLLGWAVSKLAASDTAPHVHTLGLLLKAGGKLGQTRLIEESWEALVDLDRELKKAGNDGVLDLHAWKCLARACLISGHKAYLDLQRTYFSSTLDPAVATSIKDFISSVEGEPPTELDPQIPSHTEADLQGLETGLVNQLISVQQFLGTPKTHDFFRSPLKMDLLWTSVSLPDQVRSLYDQATTDPHVQVVPSEEAEKITSTQFPLADMRFVAWKTVSELLIEAEINEETKKAAKRGEVEVDLSTKHLISSSEDVSKMSYSSGTTQDDVVGIENPSARRISRDRRRTPNEWSEEEISSTILRVRGIDLPQPPQFLEKSESRSLDPSTPAGTLSGAAPAPDDLNIGAAEVE